MLIEMRVISLLINIQSINLIYQRHIKLIEFGVLFVLIISKTYFWK